MVLDLFNESTLFDDGGMFMESAEDNYLADVEAIPVRESESIDDAYYRITLENVTNFNNILNTVAVAEMKSMQLHGTTEALYEGKDIKSFGNTIVEAIKTAWAKIKGLFQKAITYITNLSEKKLLDNYKKAVSSGRVKANSAVIVKKGVILDTSMTSNVAGTIYLAVSKCMNKLAKLDDLEVSKTSKEDAKKAAENWKAHKSEYLGEVRGAVIKSFGGSDKSVDAKSFTKELSDTVAVKFSREEVKVTPAEAYNTLTSTSVKRLRSDVKSFEKVFNNMIKDAKAIGKNAKNMDSDTAAAASTISGLKTTVYREAISVYNAAAHEMIKLTSKQAQMSRAVLRKAIASAGAGYSEDDLKHAEDVKKDYANTKDQVRFNKKPAFDVNKESADLICDLI